MLTDAITYPVFLVCYNAASETNYELTYSSLCRSQPSSEFLARFNMHDYALS